MTPAQILKAARAKIEKPENWGKGTRDRDRPWDTCCAAEAIEDLTIGEINIRLEAYKMLRWAIGQDGQWGDIVSWNDDLDRTHAEVLAAYNLAIALARNFPRAA